MGHVKPGIVLLPAYKMDGTIIENAARRVREDRVESVSPTDDGNNSIVQMKSGAAHRTPLSAVETSEKLGWEQNES